MSLTAEQYRALNKKHNKFGAKKVKDDGYAFDSKVEHERYKELLLMQLAEVIFDLKVHPKFPFKIRTERNNDIHHIWDWKPDFLYCVENPDGFKQLRYIAEDVKGGKITNTRESQRNHLLFRILYPEIELKIVER